MPRCRKASSSGSSRSAEKEALHPNTRKITVDVDHVREDLGQVTIPAAAFYERCRPPVEESIRTVLALLGDQPVEPLCVTGGGSELPLVARLLREEFGRRVRRSAYTRSATAIGLAIQANASSGYALREVFSRNFGVWREGEGGRVMVFDVIFPRGTRLPAPGEPPLAVRAAISRCTMSGTSALSKRASWTGSDTPRATSRSGAKCFSRSTPLWTPTSTWRARVSWHPRPRILVTTDVTASQTSQPSPPS